MSEMGDMVLKHNSPIGPWKWMPNTSIPEPVINDRRGLEESN